MLLSNKLHLNWNQCNINADFMPEVYNFQPVNPLRDFLLS